MSDELDKIIEIFRDSVDEALKGYLERQEVREFAEAQAKVYAREFLAAQKATTVEKKEEHLGNLKHLRAQTKGEIARLALGISKEAENVVVKVLNAVGTVLMEIMKKGLGLQ